MRDSPNPTSGRLAVGCSIRSEISLMALVSYVPRLECITCKLFVAEGWKSDLTDPVVRLSSRPGMSKDVASKLNAY
jgi:hypothetical protein